MAAGVAQGAHISYLNRKQLQQIDRISKLKRDMSEIEKS